MPQERPPYHLEKLGLGLNAFLDLDFPLWEQALLYQWITEPTDPKEMADKDVWHLWEAVFYVFLQRSCWGECQTQSSFSNFFIKTLHLSKKVGLELSFDIKELLNLPEWVEKSKRAIIAKKIPGYEADGKFWVTPKCFLKWISAQEGQRKQALLQKKIDIRKRAIKSIAQKWKSPGLRNLNKAELLKRPEVELEVAIVIRLSKNPASPDYALEYLKKQLREHNPTEESAKRGRPKNRREK